MTFFPIVFKKVYPFFENLKNLFAMQNGVLKFAFETHVLRVLLVLVGVLIFDWAPTMSLRGPVLTLTARREAPSCVRKRILDFFFTSGFSPF